MFIFPNIKESSDNMRVFAVGVYSPQTANVQMLAVASNIHTNRV